MKTVFDKLKEVAQEPDKPFSLKYVTHSKTRNTGGKVMEFEEVVFLSEDDYLNMKPTEAPSDPNAPKPVKKDPHHHKNGTFNIRVLIEGQPTETIHKVKKVLVLEINSEALVI